jgi:hypothetical protein
MLCDFTHFERRIIPKWLQVRASAQEPEKAMGAAIAFSLDQRGHLPDCRPFVVNAELTLRPCPRPRVLC